MISDAGNNPFMMTSASKMLRSFLVVCRIIYLLKLYFGRFFLHTRIGDGSYHVGFFTLKEPSPIHFLISYFSAEDSVVIGTDDLKTSLYVR